MASRSDRTSFILSRRSLLTAAAGTAGPGLIGVSAPARAASSVVPAATGPLAAVPLLPTGAPVRTAFASAEQLVVRALPRDLRPDGQ
ncbi:MAG: hypothetical protein QOE03_1427 [Micromonosporaceae bacterium]|jgi:hypothetical protein|nr:hypothetical protein [Micromonosporaceae bacterium]